MMMVKEWTARAVIERPAHFTGAYQDYKTADIEWVASQFRIDGPIEISPFPGRGNINLHTYEVFGGGKQYLLQKVNSDVFAMPYRVMKAMVASIGAQRDAIANGMGTPEWEPIELIQTHDGRDFLDLTDDHGWSVWRMMVRIPDSVSYKSLSEIPDRADQLDLAEEVGKGLAIYSDLTASIPASSVEGSLPGYRDTGLYYRQFHSVMQESRTLRDAGSLLPEDPILRASTEKHFLVALTPGEYEARKSDPQVAPYLELLAEQEPFAMGLWSALGKGRIRHTLIHGDTKIENFLFDSKTRKVKSLVDLDTIMPFTWLADFGDMVRSMVNVAGECERDLNKVVVDTDVFLAVAKGFLQASKEVTDQEVAMMVSAVQAITLELGLRFLTDYLRGDTYFQLGPNDPADLNKVRAMVQLTLYRRLVEFGPDAEDALAAIR